MLVVLGIDPGTVKMGYGVIFVKGNDIQCKDYGVITPSVKMNLSQRIAYIYEALDELYDTYKPHHTAVEKVFFGKNPQVAFKLGHAFSICLLQSEKNGSLFFEYASKFVKKSTTFSGRSSKNLVRTFVNNQLSLTEKNHLDATDALAVALCHVREWKKSRVSDSQNLQAVKL